MSHSRTKSHGTIRIYKWMVDELNLSATDLLLYACVYKHTRAGKADFAGELEELVAWCGCSVQCTKKHLQGLVQRGLIRQSTEETERGHVGVYRIAEQKPPLTK